jgi:dUTP pyrophosphatase
MIDVKMKRIDLGAILPLKATHGAAAFDLFACLEGVKWIQPGGLELVSTGWAIELPPGYEAQIRPRSGLATKNGITVANSPGTIDADYRGEVKVALRNHSDTAFMVQHGMRVAQMLIKQVPAVRLVEAKSLSETARGANGFGSTGVNVL